MNKQSNPGQSGTPSSQEDPLSFLHDSQSLEELRAEVGDFTPGEQIAVELARFIANLPVQQKARFNQECPNLVERILIATAQPNESSQ